MQALMDRPQFGGVICLTVAASRRSVFADSRTPISPSRRSRKRKAQEVHLARLAHSALRGGNQGEKPHCLARTAPES
jgi:hypothetical protein